MPRVRKYFRRRSFVARRYRFKRRARKFVRRVRKIARTATNKRLTITPHGFNIGTGWQLLAYDVSGDSFYPFHTTGIGDLAWGNAFDMTAGWGVRQGNTSYMRGFTIDVQIDTSETTGADTYNRLRILLCRLKTVPRGGNTGSAMVASMSAGPSKAQAGYMSTPDPNIWKIVKDYQISLNPQWYWTDVAGVGAADTAGVHKWFRIHKWFKRPKPMSYRDGTPLSSVIQGGYYVWACSDSTLTPHPFVSVSGTCYMSSS